MQKSEWLSPPQRFCRRGVTEQDSSRRMGVYQAENNDEMGPNPGREENTCKAVEKRKCVHGAGKNHKDLRA